MNKLNPRLHELTTKLVSIFIQNELLVLLPSEWNIHDPSPEFVSSCDKSLTRAICCNLTSRQKHWGQLELPRNSKSPCLPKSVALIGGLYTESGEKIPTGGASYRYLFFLSQLPQNSCLMKSVLVIGGVFTGAEESRPALNTYSPTGFDLCPCTNQPFYQPVGASYYYLLVLQSPCRTYNDAAKVKRGKKS